jgi:ATP-dependent Clp protease ATP-binding subunit ClpC
VFERQMFERYTDRARRAIVNGQEVSRSLLASLIEPEHLLIAVAADPEADGAVVLSGLAVAPAKLSADLTAACAKGLTKQEGYIQFSEETKRVILAALAESEAFAGIEITTAHLLLGLLASEPNKAAETLSAAGLKIEALRRAVRATPSIEHLMPPPPSEPRSEEG